MPVWPKIVYTYTVSLRTAATKWKLRQADRAPAQQDNAFATLTRQLAATSYWKQIGIATGMSYADFQSRVPVHTYERLAQAIGKAVGEELVSQDTIIQELTGKDFLRNKIQTVVDSYTD